MEPCVNCGTVEPVVPVPSCDCQTLNPCGGDARETRLLAPTRHEHDKWAANNPILSEGVLGLVKDRLFEGSVEYIIGDGEHTYTELLEEYRIYAGAPLSRTGAANHSPLAAQGKSTLDPSWLPAATSSALGAVMVSSTGAAGKVPTPASGGTTLDLSWLPVSASGAANKIPVAGNNGKLDPTWLPEATSTTLGGVTASTTTAANCVVKADANGGLDGWKDAIIDAIIASDGSGGLATDASGNMIVDFDKMPTDKFEALLKSLKMQIPLEQNLDLYVDQNHPAAADTIEDGRGTQNKPFLHIRNCVNYATQTYAVGPHIINIYIAQGTYNESVVLPVFTRTTGVIKLIAGDYDHPPTITNTGNTVVPVQCNGGEWELIRVNVACSYADPDNGVANFVGPVVVDGGATSLKLFGCAISTTYTGAASATSFNMRLVHAGGGSTLTFGVLAGYHNELSCTKGNANSAHFIHCDRQARISLPSSNIADDGITYEIPCTGSATSFVYLSSNSMFDVVGGGAHYQQFSGSTVTGMRYQLLTGASSNSPSQGFPGDQSGTCDTNTYCWITNGD